MKSVILNSSLFLVAVMIHIAAPGQTGIDTAVVLMNEPIPRVPTLSGSVHPIIEVNPASDKPAEYQSEDKEIQTAYKKSLLAYCLQIEKQNLASVRRTDSVNAYYQWALQNRKDALLRQQNTGTIILIVVLLLVLSGLIASITQFYLAFRSSKVKAVIPQTTMKASLSGVEISSSVIGLILLTISIAFFYLYLINVYPLHNLDHT